MATSIPTNGAPTQLPTTGGHLDMKKLKLLMFRSDMRALDQEANDALSVDANDPNLPAEERQRMRDLARLTSNQRSTPTSGAPTSDGFSGAEAPAVQLSVPTQPAGAPSTDLNLKGDARQAFLAAPKSV